jgi:hypothetical protein
MADFDRAVSIAKNCPQCVVEVGYPNCDPRNWPSLPSL